MIPRPRSLSRLQLAGALVLGLLLTATLLNGALRSSALPFLTPGSNGRWIGFPLPFTANFIAVDLDAIVPFTFVKRFTATGREDSAWLSGRALRDARFFLNGEPLETGQSPDDWKRAFRTDIARGLRPGRNELRVEVRNGHGPALLQLRLELSDAAAPEGQRLRTIETDPSWQVGTPGSNPQAAIVARDRMRHPESHLLPEPGQVLLSHALLLGLLFCFAAGLAWAAERRMNPTLAARLPGIVLGLVCSVWIALLCTKLWRLTLLVGFDVPAHLRYIELIVTEHRLPLADEGWSNYHPPLYHLLTGLFVLATGVAQDSVGGQIVYRLVSFAAGLANVFIARRVATRLWPGDALRCCLAIAAIGLLPMNLYISSYVTNESLHAALVSLGLMLAIDAIQARHTSTRQLVWLAAVLGLALSTKFTSLTIAPVIIAFVAVKLWLLDGEPASRTIRAVLVLAGGAGLLSGWFYLRNWIVYGDPVVWNLDLPGIGTWWMLPGFRTLDYYTSFGEAIRHPYFAGFDSFWDGVYSTFWGDGLVAGMLRVSTRHRLWNYDYMTLCYWLAFPATLALFGGVAVMIRRAFEGAEPRRQLVFGLLCTIVVMLSFSLLYISIRLPFYAQVKAFYALSMILPIALAAAEGLAWLPERLAAPGLAPLRAVYFGWLGVLACTIALAFLA